MDQHGFYVGAVHNESGLKRFAICLLRGVMVFLACYGTVVGLIESFDIPYNHTLVTAFFVMISILAALLYYNKPIFYVGYVTLLIGFTWELARYYSLADVFVNVTKADSLPTVNMESIACGTPVVTYASGGSPELVKEGKTGHIVSFGDIDGIIKSIATIKENTKAFYSTECTKCAKEDFDKKKNFLKYLSQL